MRLSRVRAKAGRTAASLAMTALACGPLCVAPLGVAPLAFAAGNVGTVEAYPGTVQPGGTVDLSISKTTCPGDSTFSGSVGATGWKFTLDPGTQSLVGSLHIPYSAQPGTYTVTGSCPTGGLIVSGSFSVSRSGVVAANRSAGSGGGLSDVSGTRLVVGTALAAAAIGGAAVYLRRRSTSIGGS